MCKKLLSLWALFIFSSMQASHDHNHSFDSDMSAGRGNIFINNNGPLYVISLPGPVQVNGGMDVMATHGGCATHPQHATTSYGPAKPAGPFRSQWMNSCHQCLNSFFNGVRTHAMRAPSFYAYVKQNRVSLAIKAAVSTYVIINFMLFRMANFLTAPQRWMYWRNDILLVQLMRMSSVDIIQELLASLSLRTHLAPDQTPIQLLFAELDDEICQLQQYNRWMETINKLSNIQNYCALSAEALLPSFLGIPVGYMTRVAITTLNLKNICYVNQELIQHTPEYLRRLMYLRRVLEEELAVDLPQVIAETAETLGS